MGFGNAGDSSKRTDAEHRACCRSARHQPRLCLPTGEGWRPAGDPPRREASPCPHGRAASDGRRRGLTGAVGRCWLQADRLTDREVLNRIATQPNRQKSERCRPLGASMASGKGRHRIYGEGREHEVAPA
jgi:hypothetical protein